MTDQLDKLKASLADRYAIEREIGSGGMATVYLAEDLKHHRKVAVKVLRPELAAVIGAERFLKEIEVTANLQHPHILQLYDSGSADSFLFYVMPYVEGESLRDKLNRERQLSVNESVEITRGVASALDYAHRHDVIHRDIKPENILLHDGQAVVADFGVALAVSAAAGARLTETGLSVGTPHYMSPEQASADRELDGRTDLYSLGATLYELLTGEPPFTGSSAQAIVAKILTEEPASVSKERHTVPPHVEAALLTALAKLPADRFTTAAEFGEALSNPVFTAATRVGEDAARVATHRSGVQKVAAASPWLLVLITGIVAAWALLRSPPAQHVARFEAVFPESLPPQTGVGGGTIALSPDGTQFVYVGPERRLYVREESQLAVQPLPGTEGAHTPFFSPDGEWVGFHTLGGALKKVALAGGPPLTAAEGSAGTRGATWGPDGTIVFVPTNTGSGLLRVSEVGGPVDTLTRPREELGEVSHRWPHWLPGGKAVVFTVFDAGGLDAATVSVLSLESGEIKSLVRGTDPRYVDTGHLVYCSADGVLLAVPFDLDHLEVTGGPTSLLEGVMMKTSGRADVGISNGGKLVYLSGQASEEELVWVDRDGIERSVDPTLKRDFSFLALSPDGTRIAVSIVSEADPLDIWIYQVGQGTLSRLTFEGQANGYPFWAPDGQRVTFHSDRAGMRRLYSKLWDGSGPAELTFETERPIYEGRWLPDGRTLVIREGTTGGPPGQDLLFVRPGVEDTASPYLVTEFNERAPTLSPDGTWLAYQSNESGQFEVYVRPFPGPGGRWQVSTNGGWEPLWSHGGGELFYKSPGEGLVVAEVQTTPTFSVGSQRVLFTVEAYQDGPSHTHYDVAPDDQQFLMVKQFGGTRTAVFVLNWFDELRARVRK